MANVTRWYAKLTSPANGTYATARVNYCAGAGLTGIVTTSNFFMLSRTKTSFQQLDYLNDVTSGQTIGTKYTVACFIGEETLASYSLQTSLTWLSRFGASSAATLNPWISIGYVTSSQAYRGQALYATGTPSGFIYMTSAASPSALSVQEGDRLFVATGYVRLSSNPVISYEQIFQTDSTKGDMGASYDATLNTFFEAETYTPPTTSARQISTRGLSPAGSAVGATGKAFSYSLAGVQKSAGFNPTEIGVQPQYLYAARAFLNQQTFDQLAANASGLDLSPAESTPPTIGAFTPAAGSVSPTQSISVTVTDDDGIGSATLSVDFPALDRSEIVYRAGAFLEAYLASTVTPVVVDEHTVSLAFSIVRSPGWPSAFTVNVEAVDELGASSESSSAYTLSSTEFPTLANVSPASGSSLYADSIISFDVLDATSLLRVYIKAKYADGAEEVIWFGTAFAGQFGDSTQTSIAGGYHFAVQRVGGWQKAPQIYVDAIDSEGNIP